jgi:hypothetical protein
MDVQYDLTRSVMSVTPCSGISWHHCLSGISNSPVPAKTCVQHMTFLLLPRHKQAKEETAQQYVAVYSMCCPYGCAVGFAALQSAPAATTPFDLVRTL